MPRTAGTHPRAEIQGQVDAGRRDLGLDERALSALAHHAPLGDQILKATAHSRPRQAQPFADLELAGERCLRIERLTRDKQDDALLELSVKRCVARAVEGLDGEK